VVTARAAAIVIDNGRETVCAGFPLSLTCSRKLEVPTAAALGVPLMTPVLGARLKPLGRDPTGTDQVTGEVPPEATAVVLYAVSAVPEGREVVTIESGGAMVSDSALLSLAPAASVALTVNPDVPVDDGVPLITPEPEFRPSPAGSPPETTAHVIGAVPPVSTTLCEYNDPETPPGSDVVVITGGDATTMDKGRVAVAPLRFALSFTTATKLKVPVADGVPLITPALVSMERPFGSEPLMDQVKGAVPPFAVSV
jgi:hypothetical protein